ncbi:cysteine hydrolase family protein [Pusillimonas sp.]|uniref:cysteine hydrolase family protein n=1 Tax=Pusillimonas sp. TaxID=3040095 RepID=UPI0037C947FE
MERRFGVDTIRPAVVTIDMHRGHLDPAVATMPVKPGTEARTIQNNAAFLAAARAADVPVIHMLTQYIDPCEIRMNPFWRTRADNPTATRKLVERHQIQGGPGCEIMPEILDSTYDLILDTKRRYDCFQATDLELVLKARGATMVMFTGINTNSCVLATTVRANTLDFASVVVEDCVDTMDGPELHAAGLDVMRTAFGWVMTAEQIQQDIFSALSAGKYVGAAP